MKIVVVDIGIDMTYKEKLEVLYSKRKEMHPLSHILLFGFIDKIKRGFELKPHDKGAWMKPGEVVYCPSKDRFFAITNVGDDWVFGEWVDSKEVVGHKLPKSMFRKTSYLEWAINQNQENFG